MLRIAPTKYLCAVQCNVEDYGLKRGINEKGGVVPLPEDICNRLGP